MSKQNLRGYPADSVNKQLLGPSQQTLQGLPELFKKMVPWSTGPASSGPGVAPLVTDFGLWNVLLSTLAILEESIGECALVNSVQLFQSACVLITLLVKQEI